MGCTLAKPRHVPQKDVHASPMKRNYRHLDEMAGSHSAAERIVPYILKVAGDVRSVVDVGGGDGGWLRVFQQHGVADVRLFDSPDVEPHLQIEKQFFSPMDFKTTLPGIVRYDLALCLEFIEHIPDDRGRALVEWLTRASDKIVFSAAIPGQGGKGHINERAPGYWTRLFSEYGFLRVDAVRPAILHDLAIPWWYRQNLVMYVSPSAMTVTHAEGFIPDDFMLVHSSAFDRLANPDLRIVLPGLVPSIGLTINKGAKRLRKWFDSRQAPV